MPVIDTVYLRKAFRGKGLGRKMVEQTLLSFTGEDIGFSYPVSKGLLQVLQKVLLNNSTLRDRVWQCSYTGEEGYRENLWFSLRRLSNYA